MVNHRYLFEAELQICKVRRESRLHIAIGGHQKTRREITRCGLPPLLSAFPSSPENNEEARKEITEF